MNCFISNPQSMGGRAMLQCSLTYNFLSHIIFLILVITAISSNPPSDQQSKNFSYAMIALFSALVALDLHVLCVAQRLIKWGTVDDPDHQRRGYRPVNR